MAILRIRMESLRLEVAMDDFCRCDIKITVKAGSYLVVLNKHFIVFEYSMATAPLKSNTSGPEVQAPVGVRYYIS